MSDELFVPITQEDIDGLNTVGGKIIPSLVIEKTGDWSCPDGWMLTDKMFVDSSGLDDKGPALSVDQMKSEMVVDKGYAIIGIGQFQVWVGVFEHE